MSFTSRILLEHTTLSFCIIFVKARAFEEHPAKNVAKHQIMGGEKVCWDEVG